MAKTACATLQSTYCRSLDDMFGRGNEAAMDCESPGERFSEAIGVGSAMQCSTMLMKQGFVCRRDIWRR